MKHSLIKITFQIILFLLPLLTGCAPAYLDSFGYYNLPGFMGYSGEDAAFIYIAYKDDLDNYEFSDNYEDYDFREFNEDGSSILILDGQSTKPSEFLKKLKVKPGKHTFKLQGKMEVELLAGYDPVNYPKSYYSEVIKFNCKIEKREVLMLLMFWENGQYSYFLVPLGTRGSVKPMPSPKPGTTMQLGDREVSYFVLKSFHEYSLEIAD